MLDHDTSPSGVLQERATRMKKQNQRFFFMPLLRTASPPTKSHRIHFFFFSLDFSSSKDRAPILAKPVDYTEQRACGSLLTHSYQPSLRLKRGTTACEKKSPPSPFTFRNPTRYRANDLETIWKRIRHHRPEFRKAIELVREHMPNGLRP